MNDFPAVFDAHIDTLLRIGNPSEFLDGTKTHVDGPRLSNAGVGHVVMAVCPDAQVDPETAWKHGLRMFDELADFNGCRLLLAAEGCRYIADSGEIPADLAIASLTWNGSSSLGGGIGTDEGLTEAGIKLAGTLHDAGVVLDVSHLCDRSRHDLLATGLDGISATHCNSRRLRDHPRNLPDDDLREIAALGGVAGITFVPYFLSAKTSTVADIVAHVEHAAEVMGIDNVGFGSDFDGVVELPEGIEGCQSWHVVIRALFDAGWSREEIEKVAGGNWRRVFGV